MSRHALAFLLIHTLLSLDCFWSFTLKNCTVEFSETVVVICQSRHLQEVPDDVPLNAEVLDVSFNQISQIRSCDLSGLSQLFSLSVSQNGLLHIHDQAFLNLTKLVRLNLSRNKLTNLTELTFAGLKQLTSLNLKRNRISQIAPNVFPPLLGLKGIILDSNCIQNVTDTAALFKLPNIERISLSSNPFTTFSSDELPFNSSNIMFLALEYKKYIKFGLKRDIFPHLRTMSLEGIKSLEWNVVNDTLLSGVTLLSLSLVSPESFNAVLNSTPSLKNLTLASLNQKTLKFYVQSACSIASMETLTVTFSPLKFIDDEVFRSCSRLKELKLPLNNLEELSEQSLKSLTQIRLLRLAENDLREVPVTVRDLWTLEVLDLGFNSIREIHCLDFANLTKLKELILRKNQILLLEQCVFQNLQRLNYLDIGKNSLFRFNEAFQVDLSQLKILLLTGNRNRFTLYPGVFRNLSSLGVLNLKANDYVLTVDGVFEGLEKLHRLICWTSVMTKGVFRGLRDLNYLELHMSKLLRKTNGTDEPGFPNLPDLETLLIFVDPKYSPDISPDLFRGLGALNALNVDHFFQAPIHPNMFTHTPLLTSLTITNSDLSSLSPEVFRPIPNLQTLDLSSNKLKTLSFLPTLDALQMLRADDNHLSVINVTIFQTLPSLTYLDVSKNALLCDCLNAGFLKWVRSSNRTQVVDGAQYRCVSPVTHTEHRFLDFDTRPCKIDFQFILFVSTSGVTLLTLLVSSVYRFLRWQLAYAYYLFLAYLYDTKRRRKREAAHRYDAFISYNVHDEEWVYNEMLPALEGEQGWRLCLHHRDFQPGKPIVENITDAIYGSRKTLCVISRHYLQSEWCSREIQMASVRLFDEQTDVLVLVFLDDVPPWLLSPYYQMRRLVKRRSYLSWPRAAQHRGVFWEKLRQALQSDVHRPDDAKHHIVEPHEGRC